jgi:hypothetical protein
LADEKIKPYCGLWFVVALEYSTSRYINALGFLNGLHLINTNVF